MVTMTGRQERIKALLEERYRHAEEIGPHPFAERSALANVCRHCDVHRDHPVHVEQADLQEQATPSEKGPTSITSSTEVSEEEREEAKKHTGSMVALFPDMRTADQLVQHGGEPVEDLHVTLAYLPDGVDDDRVDEAKALLAEVAGRARPISGEVAGVGHFDAQPSSDDKPVTWADIQCDELPGFRQQLVDALDGAGFEVAKNHGYTPHMTLAYDDIDPPLPKIPLLFSAIWLCRGDERTPFMLSAAQPEEAKQRRRKHRYQPMSHISPGWLGPIPCAQCGRPSTDPDHDGDVDEGDPNASGGSTQMAATMGPTDMADRDNENALIKRNQEKPEAKLPHRFTPASWTAPNGHPRCLTCGDEEPIGGICNAPGGEPTGDEIPLQASEKGFLGAQVVERPLAPERPFVPADVTMPDAKQARAFLTEVNGKTLLTAPASVLTDGLEKSMTSNKHMLWLGGRFVGAEKANRNGAFWTTADLELGEPTVKHGPLNWLHESHHIIGSLVDSELRFPAEGMEQAAVDAAVAQGAMVEPYISASAAAWRWIWPDECFVIEQASDSQKLWYSMECISESVECVGEAGCGASASYMDYLNNIGGTCAHMAQKSADRRFADPTFLGGAVIVPPVRPGWGAADARVMRQASAMAEKAFDQAGQPDIPASEFEQVVGQVLVAAGV